MYMGSEEGRGKGSFFFQYINLKLGLGRNWGGDFEFFNEKIIAGRGRAGKKVNMLF